jgi:hypothetical protein
LCFARENLVNELNRQHGAENVIVIKETKDKKPIQLQGDIKNIKGDYEVQIMANILH